MISRVKALATNIINSGYDEQLTPYALLLRIRVLNIIDMILFITAQLFIFIQFYWGISELALFVFLIYFIVFIKILLLRRYQFIILFSYLSLALNAIALSGALALLGGFFDSLLCWGFVLPLLAAFLVDWKGMLVYFTLVLLLVSVFFYLSLFNYVPLYQLSGDIYHYLGLFNRSMLVVVMYLFLAYFLSVNAQIKNRLSQAKANLDLAKNKYRRLANFDPLTKAYKRETLMAYLGESIQSEHRRGRVMLCFIDLDDFKKANDDYGHKVGDDLLRLVAKRLKGIIKTGDMVARLGGDEFVLLLNDIDSDNKAENIAWRIIDAFNKPFYILTNRIIITASLGLAYYPDDADNATALLKKADKAMFLAKREGKNRFKFYDPEAPEPKYI